MTTSTKITIARALVELKTLKGRIERASEVPVLMVKVGEGDKSKPADPSYRTLAEAEQAMLSNHQSLIGLLKRREAVKRALVKANAETEVTIDGVVYSLAEAIEMKAFVCIRKHVLLRLGAQLRRESGVVGVKNSELETRIDSLRQTQGDNVELLERNIADMRVRGTVSLVDPNGLKKFIEAEELKINNFLTEVDVALNEVNASTQIDVVQA